MYCDIKLSWVKTWFKPKCFSNIAFTTSCWILNCLKPVCYGAGYVSTMTHTSTYVLDRTAYNCSGRHPCLVSMWRCCWTQSIWYFHQHVKTAMHIGVSAEPPVPARASQGSGNQQLPWHIIHEASRKSEIKTWPQTWKKKKIKLNIQKWAETAAHYSKSSLEICLWSGREQGKTENSLNNAFFLLFKSRCIWVVSCHQTRTFLPWQERVNILCQSSSRRLPY